MLTQHSSPGVYILYDQFRGVHRRQPVRGIIAAVGTDHSQFDRVGGEEGSGGERRQKCGTEKCQERPAGTMVVHKNTSFSQNLGINTENLIFIPQFANSG